MKPIGIKKQLETKTIKNTIKVKFCSIMMMCCSIVYNQSRGVGILWKK